jgi:cell division GTPase FtsZ
MSANDNNDNKNDFDFAEPASETNPPALETTTPAGGFDDFDFVDHYGDDEEVTHENLLPENTVPTSLNCAVVGVGGGGGKMAKAFLDLGYNRTLLVNTTAKDIPSDVDDKHVVLIPDADGIGKDVNLGKAVFDANSTVVEDALRTKLGKVDWLFVCAGGGGGTGYAVASLHTVFERYLKSVQAQGEVVYITSWPTAQECLNPTISKNALALINDVSKHTHIVLDNERQVKLLRGKVGMLNLFPTANTAFAKLVTQVLKLSNDKSPIQSFDTKDLERCLRTPQRMFIGSTMVKDPATPNLGAMILQNCMKRSPCPAPKGKPKTGALLLIASSEMANDPEISKHMDAAIGYVGGRTDTLFSGVYINDSVPGLVALLCMNGLPKGK